LSLTHEQTCKGQGYEETTPLDEIRHRRKHRAASGPALGTRPPPTRGNGCSAESRHRQTARAGCALTNRATLGLIRKKAGDNPRLFLIFRVKLLHCNRSVNNNGDSMKIAS
jgi:hypothetical protein